MLMRIWEPELSYTVLLELNGNLKWYTHFSKHLTVLFWRVKHIPTIWLRHSILRYILKENKDICPHKDLYHIPMATLFLIAWLEMIQVSTNTQWFSHTMENYLAIKRNQLLIHIIMWMNLKIFMLNERG